MSTPWKSEASLYNSHVVIAGLGGLFGLILLVCGFHIYIRVHSIDRQEAQGVDRNGFEVADYWDPVSRRRATVRGRGRHRLGRRDHQVMETPNMPTGLDWSIVAQLPTFIVSTEAALKNDMECAVCLEEFAEVEAGRGLPNCNYCFHMDCIDMWLFSHSSCPLCRCEVGLSKIPPESASVVDDIEDEQRSLPAEATIVMPSLSSAATVHPELEESLFHYLGGPQQQQVMDLSSTVTLGDFDLEVNANSFSGLPSLSRATVVPAGWNRRSFSDVQI